MLFKMKKNLQFIHDDKGIKTAVMATQQMNESPFIILHMQLQKTYLSSAKKSFPLSSTIIKAGKFST